ncbi:hypothetical protein ACQP04_21575 [Pseudonocardia halophobica]|uniref:hypothetical protein n=1 Tax=Pseudonocardia halophobica TaxID=29401 RepID=UPI003D8EAE82
MGRLLCRLTADAGGLPALREVLRSTQEVRRYTPSGSDAEIGRAARCAGLDRRLAADPCDAGRRADRRGARRAGEDLAVHAVEPADQLGDDDGGGLALGDRLAAEHRDRAVGVQAAGGEVVQHHHDRAAAPGEPGEPGEPVQHLVHLELVPEVPDDPTALAAAVTARCGTCADCWRSGPEPAWRGETCTSI